MVIDIPEGVTGYDERWIRRAFDKIEHDERTDCWLWKGAGWKTVPIAVYKKQMKSVHRKFWEFWKRNGMPLDSKQQLTRCALSLHCVNPDHHQIRHWENQDGERKAPEVCRHGHSMVGAYLNKRTGYLYCRTCSKEASQRNYRKVRQVYDEVTRNGRIFVNSKQIRALEQQGDPVQHMGIDRKIEKSAEPAPKPMKPAKTVEPRRKGPERNWAGWAGDHHRKWMTLGEEEWKRRMARFRALAEERGGLENLMDLPEEELEALVSDREPA